MLDSCLDDIQLSRESGDKKILLFGYRIGAGLDGVSVLRHLHFAGTQPWPDSGKWRFDSGIAKFVSIWNKKHRWLSDYSDNRGCLPFRAENPTVPSSQLRVLVIECQDPPFGERKELVFVCNLDTCAEVFGRLPRCFQTSWTRHQDDSLLDQGG